MIPTPIVETTSIENHTLSMTACGLTYLWENGYLNILAGDVLIIRQECPLWIARVKFEAARDAHHNYLEALS